MEFVDDFEQDSGMESSPMYGDDSSKDDTPERKPEDLGLSIEVVVSATVEGNTDKKSTPTPNPTIEVEDVSKESNATDENTVARLYPPGEDYSDEPDETWGERLWGLTEMLPSSVVNTTHFVVTKSWSGVKSFYSFSRTASWIVASSSVILFAPVVFELERAKMDEMQKSQQKQFLLGPSAAMVGAGAPPPPIPR